MASALFGLGAVTGPLLGPTIGGYLIEWFNWHWVFLVNVPLGIIVAIMCTRVVEEPGFKPARNPIDVFGIALLAIGMASLQYVLEEGNRDGWDSIPIMVLIAIASVCLITFIVHELEAPYPVVDLRVFKNASYSAGTGINFLLGLVLFAGNFLFALYCGTVMHYVALDIGKIFLVAGLIQIVVMPLIGKLVTRVDPRRMLVFGILGTSLSLWLNAHLTDQAGFWDLTRPQFVRSVSMGFIFIPISMLALSDLPNQIRGNATGLFNLTPRTRRVDRHRLDGPARRPRQQNPRVLSARGHQPREPAGAGADGGDPQLGRTADVHLGSGPRGDARAQGASAGVDSELQRGLRARHAVVLDLLDPGAVSQTAEARWGRGGGSALALAATIGAAHRQRARGDDAVSDTRGSSSRAIVLV